MDRPYSSLTGFPIKGSLAIEIRCAYREGCAKKMKEETDHHLVEVLLLLNTIDFDVFIFCMTTEILVY